MSSAPLQSFSLQGIACAACVKTLTEALRKNSGISEFAINFADRTLVVQSELSSEALISCVQQAGYDASPLEDAADQRKVEALEIEQNSITFKRAFYTLAVGALLMVTMMGGWMPTLVEQGGIVASIVTAIITLMLMCKAAGHIYLSAFRQLKQAVMTMDTLVAMGTSAAWLYSVLLTLWVVVFGTESIVDEHLYYEAALMVLGFVLLGQGLEGRARRQTSAAIRELMRLTPDEALREQDGVQQLLPLALIVNGDFLRIRPGERIPVDGKIVEGSSLIDESMLTGEAEPQLRSETHEVVAGTLNGQGSLLIEVIRTGKQTILAKIVEAVRKAQMSRPPLAQFADKIASIFVPVVIAIAVVAALLWLLYGPAPASSYAMTVFMTVLIVACPCALGLATPLAIMVGVGRAARQGVLIRNGEALQKAKDITLVLFDKTGTLTEGKPRVVDHLYFGDESEKIEVNQAIISIEARAEHPLAEALVAFLQQESGHKPVLAFKAEAGYGVSAKCLGRRWLIGSRDLMLSEGVSLLAAEESLRVYDQAGQSVILVSCDARLVALFVVADALRVDSALAVAELKAAGKRVAMLSGDHPSVAAHIARKVGISEVYGGLKPTEKLECIRRYQKQGEVVAMVGDGINDAPALAAADVGFAMGGGTDIAIASADISLLSGSAHTVLSAIYISEQTVKNIKQNLFGAFIYNLLMIPLAAGVFYPLFGVLLNPMFAGAAMALSSITVVLNANRLRWKGDPI